MEIRKYTSEKKREWDDFVSTSPNGTFLFYRDYMEYHSDRFEDYSLMIYNKNKLVSLFPANVDDKTIYSHRGLTFGGLIITSNNHYSSVVESLNTILAFYKDKHINSLIIKAQPYFYHQRLSQELSLCLLRNKIQTKTVLGVAASTQYHTFPKRCVRTNKLELYETCWSDNFPFFWKILEDNLKERHNSKPVHSLDEVEKLQSSFPQNIKLFCIKNKESKQIEAGALLYLNRNIVKVQYFATTPSGRQNRASDVLYYNIINHFKNEFDFIDFGTCEEGDNDISMSLLETKEKFGASSFPIFTFELPISTILKH